MDAEDAAPPYEKAVEATPKTEPKTFSAIASVLPWNKFFRPISRDIAPVSRLIFKKPALSSRCRYFAAVTCVPRPERVRRPNSSYFTYIYSVYLHSSA
ncbi:hypothetical protein EVAR_44777_1 [Eumeta japonica]|uniref:Uncharacterized protein n=1 Tax=Eumeta variegata TaxID=151549 RepID=A0A4C1Y7F9_EUMVA|nr:hypothetical protein EVAR_44777_1 [Eumeta japonica]